MRPLLLFLLVTVAPLAAQAPFRQVADLIPGDAGPVLGLADFDQDGDLDLLTNGTGIYLNDGNGSFTPHPVLSAITVWSAPPGTPLTVAGLVRICAIGDFTGDGLPDAVVSAPAPAPSNNSTLHLWVNQGNGVLASAGLVSPLVTSPMALASGDVDADGDLDLVVSHVSTAGLYPVLFPLILLLNNGAGVFTAAAPAQMPATPLAPRQLALRDFDGDGLVDLVAGVFAYAPGYLPPSPPLLFLNGPPGTFATAGISVPASSAFDAFAVEDIDGDGLADLVLDTSPPWSIWTCVAPNAPPPLVLISAGAGAFWPAYSAIAGPLTKGMPTLVDLTADGVPDLLRLTYRGAEVYPLSSTTAFALTAQPPVFLAPDSPPSGFGVSSAVGDLDGDGDQDVVVFTAQGNEVLFNDSSGSPVVMNGRLAASKRTAQTYSSADVEGDGDEDLVLGFADCGGGTQVDVAWNDGRGNLVEGQSLPCPSCGALNTLGPRVFFDADQDGDVDAFVGPWGTPTPMPPYKVLINSGGTFVVSQTFLPPAPNACFSLAVGDIDGDGDMDVVGGRGFVFKNDGAGSFQLTGGMPVYAIQDLALADLDGDGDLDAAFTGAPSGLMINDGTGSFTLSSLAAFPSGYLVEAADLDGDGDTDLLSESAVYMNMGALSFAQAGVVPLVNWYSGNVANDLRTADVDGDGDQDVLDARGWLYRNSGTGSFSAGEAFPGATSPIVAADFDRDGDPDLVRYGPRMLTNMTRQLSRGVPARPGRPASLEIGGPPSAAWELYASPGTTSFPLPPFGTVRLDLAGLQLAFSGTIGANGLSTVTGVVPTTPGIVGVTVNWQAVIHHPYGPRLTGLEVTTVAAF